MNTDVMNRIEDIQRGRAGIYPYHVAQQIAAEFAMPIHEAIDHVTAHVKIEMLRNMWPNHATP